MPNLLNIKYTVTWLGALATVMSILLFTSSASAQITEIYDTPGAGTFVVPCGVTSITVHLYGAGGGGGASSTGGVPGAGGGAGGYVSNTYAVTPGTSFNYFVASGGTGAANGSAWSGQNGQQSTFSGPPAIWAAGGTGGGGSANNPGVFGIGGAASGWAGGITGGNGTAGNDPIGGFGGGSAGPHGGNGGPGGAAGVPGGFGSNYGGGGGGGGDKSGSSNPGGGDGSDGAVIIVYNSTVTQPEAGEDINLCGVSSLSGNIPDAGWTGTWTVISGPATVTSPNIPTSGFTGLASGTCSTFEWTFSMVGCPNIVDEVTICDPVQCNDDPCGAFALPVNIGGCSLSTYSNVGSTASSGMVEPGCGNWDGADVWFTAVVPANGQLEINAIDAPGGASMYPGLALYTGTCDNLTHAGCDYSLSTSSTAPAEITYLGTPGEIVYIRYFTYYEYESNFQICAYSSPLAYGDITAGATSVTCGTPMTFMDPGGTGNYQDNSAGQYVLCPDTPGQYVTIDFSTGSNFFDIEAGYDKLTILDGDTDSSGIIGQWDGTNNPGIITSSAPDGCLTILFQSDYLIQDLGWEATVSCTSTIGTNTLICSPTNCSGGCGQWICADGLYPTSNDGNGIEDLAINSSGCFTSAGEVASKWFYFTVLTDGTIEFSFAGPNGQDYNLAIWGPSTNGVPPCPMNTNESPIRCSQADVQNTGNPVGLSEALGNGEAYEGTEGDGWLDALDVVAGETYAMILNIYMQGNPQPEIDLTIGGSGTLDCSVLPLPVKLSSFAGINQGERNFLDWITESEINNDYFILERSIDGFDWQQIAKVEGHGTSQKRHYYSFLDETPHFPVSYYRLVQYDYNGEFELSEVIVINTEKNLGNKLINNVFPNPANTYSTFIFSEVNNEEPVTVELLDGMGKVILSNNYQKVVSGQVGSIQTADIASGMYRLVVTQGDKIHAQKLNIVR